MKREKDFQYSMNKIEFYDALKKIPKSEIHLHSEALISRDTASRILSRIDPKYKNKLNVDKLFSYDNLKGFIDAFLLLQSAYNNLEDFKELFSNILPYLKRNGIIYAELFFSPSSFIKNGSNFKDLLSVFVEEIKKIKIKEKIDVKIIIDVSRTFGIENAMRNLNESLKCNCKSIIGIGLGGDEKKGPARDFEEVFRVAKKNKLHRVVHAGEDVGSESIWDAINYLDAERIGHGISAIKDKRLIEYLVKRQIPLEICPTSNVFTKRYVKKMEDHPIKDFYKKNILVTLNTDDPAFFNVELLDEYWNLYSKLDFSLLDIKKIIINGFKASFLPPRIKKKYIKEVNIKWGKYF